MGEHRHPQYVEGCYRCELGRDEASALTAREVIAGALDLGYDESRWTADDILTALTDAGFSVVRLPDREALAAVLNPWESFIASDGHRSAGTREAGDLADAVLALLGERS